MLHIKLRMASKKPLHKLSDKVDGYIRKNDSFK